MRSYGSIQFRDIDRPALLREVGKLASHRQIKFLIGPDLDGWTAVYPEPHGQDGTIAAALAEALNASALHLLIHNEGFLAYNYYRGAELVHGYNTHPDYFDGNPWPPIRPRERGKLISLQRLVGPKIKLTHLLVILSRLSREYRDRPVKAEHLAEIAQSLGIQNAATSYAGLFAGDRETIAGWEDFEHVPDLKLEPSPKEASG